MERGAQLAPTLSPRAQWLQHCGQASNLLSGWPHDLGAAFGEGVSRAAGVQVAKTADAQAQTHGILL